MKRWTTIVLGVVLVASLASANAPPDEYVVYGQTDTQITDKQTHLVWQRLVAQNAVVISEAQTECSSNGRLPTYRELLTLVDEDPHLEWDPEAGASTPRYIDPNAFPETPAGPFWSMSPGSAPQTLKVVDFGTGESRDEDISASAYVRCVTDLP